jgi:hypothetical protein
MTEWEGNWPKYWTSDAVSNFSCAIQALWLYFRTQNGVFYARFLAFWMDFSVNIYLSWL